MIVMLTRGNWYMRITCLIIFYPILQNSVTFEYAHFEEDYVSLLHKRKHVWWFDVTSELVFSYTTC